MEVVAHEGRHTVYRVRDRGGRGSPVLFVHGTGATHGVWRRQFALADHHQIVGVDLSGHGESEDVHAAPGWETVSAYASDVQSVLEETSARYLVGHSLGGAICVHVAVHRDVDIDGVIVIGTGTRLPVHEHILHLAETDLEGLVEFLHGPDRLFHEVDDAVIEHSKSAMLDCDHGVVYRDFRTADEIDLRDELSRIDVPILAVCGEYDRLTPVDVHANLVDRVSFGRVETIPGAGHMAMLEQPTAVNEALASFLAGDD